MQNVFDVYKQIATSNGLNEREQTLNELKDSYEDYLSHTLTASKFTIGLNVYDVSIQDVNDQNNKDLRDDKFMICSMSTPIVVGDIGIWDKYNEHYIVLSDEKKTVESNKRFKIYPCNYLLKWVDIKGKSDRESYCVVEDATMYTDGIKEETIIKYQDQMIKIVIPSSVEINKFKEDDRLFVDGKFYVITSANRLTKGITRLTAVSTLKSEYDNEEDLLKYLRHQSIVEQFVRFADSKGVKRRNLLIHKSYKLLERSLYGNIIYNILGREQYIRYINQSDATVKKALDILERGEAFPKAPEATPIIEDKKDDGKEKRTAQAGSFVEDPTQLFRYASVC